VPEVSFLFVEEVEVDWEQQFASAFQLYRQRPSPENGVALAKAATVYLVQRSLSAQGPCLAIFEIIHDRKHDGTRPWQVWLCVKGLRYFLKKDRVGWNDYHMIRWQLTQDQSQAEEIHRRANHVGGPSGSNWAMVRFTAQWMADSYRQQDEDFDAALKTAEDRCLLCKHGELKYTGAQP
jgi:hypothetical protein